jgi:8-oxo-dGTP pyrophosphatase MutT (NUDIX family)
MTLRADAVRELSAWGAPTPDQAGLRASYLGYLADHDDAMWRTCRTGHLTASALVLDPVGGRVLLTRHPKVGLWLQMGGHCEASDHTLAEAALREASEESGIVGLDLVQGPVQLDRHQVRCGPDMDATEHLDVQYVALAGWDAHEMPSIEAPELRWWPVESLPEDADQSVRGLVSRALAVVA